MTGSPTSTTPARRAGGLQRVPGQRRLSRRRQRLPARPHGLLADRQQHRRPVLTCDQAGDADTITRQIDGGAVRVGGAPFDGRLSRERDARGRSRRAASDRHLQRLAGADVGRRRCCPRPTMLVQPVDCSGLTRDADGRSLRQLLTLGDISRSADGTWRSWFAIAVAWLGALSAAGCTDHGSYTVTWTFVGGGADAGPRAGCGLHGVDSIRVIGREHGGRRRRRHRAVRRRASSPHERAGRDLDLHRSPARRARACRSTPIDAQGQPVPDPTATVTVAKDATTRSRSGTVELTPRPECSDGIDNDGDGRVDLDDPDCAGDPNTATE